PDLPADFLLMNGDVLTDLPFGTFFERHVANGEAFTMAAAKRQQTIDYGVLEVAGGHLIGFREKPRLDCLVSMGVYMVNSRVLDRFVPQDTKYGFDDLMLDMLPSGEPVKVEPYDGYWLDIGRPDDYVEAIECFERKRHELLPAERAHGASTEDGNGLAG